MAEELPQIIIEIRPLNERVLKLNLLGRNTVSNNDNLITFLHSNGILMRLIYPGI